MAISQLPRYAFDPATQTYRLLSPQEQATPAKPLYDLSGGADATAGTPGTTGSGGFIGDVGLGLMGYGEALGGMAPGAMAAGFIGQALADQAIAQNAATDQALAQANQEGKTVGVTMGLAGPVATTNEDVVSGLQGLAVANATQNAQAVADAQAANAAAAAASAAQDVADAADAADADAGAANAAAAAAAGDSGGGDSGGGDGGVGDAGDAGDSGDSGDGDGGDGDYRRGGYIMNYAQGGVAAAKHAQSMGRGQDTMLVHMTPGEVNGLQALAKAGGGSLTINPNTGLPEAGFLSSMLPTIAGAALTGMSGGAINPMTASLLIGGGYGMATGSLKKGLMAGLGAFGGANIAAGLGASAAAGTAENLAAPAVESTMATPLEIAQTNIDPSLLESGMSAEQVMSQGIVGSPTAQGAVMSAGQYAPTINAMDVANLRTVPSMTVTGVPATSPTGFVQGDYMGNLSQMGKGVQNLVAPGQAGTDARAAFMSGAGGISSIAPAATPIVQEAMKPPAGPEQKPSYIRRYDVDVANRSRLGSEYAPGSSYERQMVDYTFSPRPIYSAAAGGLTALAKGGTAKKPKKIGGDQYYKFAQDRRDSSMEGALEANFAAGGQPRFLSGGGDGMSDDIPATIDGKQPARLADGEFVVPADVVSHLGNGSSKAGAKKLYKMMDRIRQARTGKKSQAPEVKAERHMPA